MDKEKFEGLKKGPYIVKPGEGGPEMAAPFGTEREKRIAELSNEKSKLERRLQEVKDELQSLEPDK